MSSRVKLTSHGEYTFGSINKSLHSCLNPLISVVDHTSMVARIVDGWYHRAVERQPLARIGTAGKSLAQSALFICGPQHLSSAFLP